MTNEKFTMYLDESGVASLTDYKANYFILSAIIVEHHVDMELSAYFNHIKRTHNLPLDTNFHTVDFFETKKSQLFLTNTKATKFCASMTEFIKISPFHIGLYAIDKRMLRKILKLPNGYQFKGNKNYKVDKEIGYEIVARKALLEFAKFLKQKKAKGYVVAESRRGSDHVLLDSFLAAQQTDQFKQKSLQKYSIQLRERVVSLCFENKNALRAGLEMADLFSYSYYKKLNKEISLLKKRGMPNLWRIIENKAETKKISMLSNRDFAALAKDKIDKIAKRIETRLNEFSDLVNPT